MIVWLDHLIFGNGCGLGSPHFDKKFYWLGGKRGQLYHWIGGFGAQIGSFQWTHPKPGERRKLFGHEFTPFDSERCWLRVRVSWATHGITDIQRLHLLKENLEASL